MALIAFNTWVKFVLKLRITKTFGPMIKVLIVMVGDLGQFMTLWFIIIFMFVCVSSLLFAETNYLRFDLATIFYYESSLASWDLRTFCSSGEEDIMDKDIECQLSVVFLMGFLLVNLVLLLNYVIAILSSTYAAYEDKKLGLYYEVIVGSFPAMEYDDRYGAIACAQPPFNMMLLPFQWITVFPLSDEFLIKYNQFLCHALYLLIAVVITAIFTVLNTIYVPIAYVSHTIVLI